MITIDNLNDAFNKAEDKFNTYAVEYIWVNKNTFEEIKKIKTTQAGYLFCPNNRRLQALNYMGDIWTACIRIKDDLKDGEAVLEIGEDSDLVNLIP